jgi:hypothetical protein
LPFARLLLREAAERPVWGTDWPHPGPAGPIPHDGDLLDVLWHWCGGAALYRKIWVDNSARLYGFFLGERHPLAAEPAQPATPVAPRAERAGAACDPSAACIRGVSVALTIQP